MKKGLVRRVFLSVAAILFASLVIQLVIQVFFIDDLYQMAKQNELVSAFDVFEREYEHMSLDEDTINYNEDHNAAILVIDGENQLLNDMLFYYMSYVTVEVEGGFYRVLLGDRVDERGYFIAQEQGFNLGDEITISGYLYNGTNVITIDAEGPTPLAVTPVELRGEIVSTHFMPKHNGVFSDQNYKLIREVNYILEDLESESFGGLYDFIESETGLVLTVMSRTMGDGTRLISLYTTEDLSNTFVVLNKYFILLFLLQILILLGLSFKLSKWITHPIRLMTEEAKRIARLDFSAHTVLESKDELEDLSKSLGHITENMARNIQAFEEDAKEKAANERRMRDLLANLSHEFKTPLSVMTGFLEMMKEPEVESQYCIETIEEEIEKLNELTKETLLLCESESLESYSLETSFDIKPLFSLDRFQQLIESKEIKIELNLQNHKVMGDAKKIQLVIDNLVSNAIKYSPHGASITIGSNDRGTDINIYVENFGVTLAPETLGRVWEKYYTGNQSRNKAFAGNGLGLSIVSTILNHHSSNYGVYNNDASVVFYFSLKKDVL